METQQMDYTQGITKPVLKEIVYFQLNGRDQYLAQLKQVTAMLRSLSSPAPNLTSKLEEQKKDDFVPPYDADGEGGRESLYTENEWAQVQLAWALINGYKANKGRAGYKDDYDRGKAILDEVRAGIFR